jgi:hypothetical protein
MAAGHKIRCVSEQKRDACFNVAGRINAVNALSFTNSDEKRH